MSYYQDVKAFHDKFDLSYDGPPRKLPQEEMLFRLKFLLEELEEVEEAMLQGKLHNVGAELSDLVWVVLGLAHRMGLPFDKHWELITNANMAKVKAGPNGEGSKRGSPLDIIKPEGWQSPNHAALPEYK